MPLSRGNPLQSACSKTPPTISELVSPISLIFSTHNSSFWGDGPVCRSASTFFQSFANSLSAMLLGNHSLLQGSISAGSAKMSCLWEQQRSAWSNFLQQQEGKIRHSLR